MSRSPSVDSPADVDPCPQLGKIARVLSGRHGIDVVVGPEGPRVEKNRIVIPDLKVSVAASEELLLGYVDLLAARAKYSDLDLMALQTSSLVQAVAQIMEDRRVCERLFREYQGARAYIRSLRLHAAAQAARNWYRLTWRDKLMWRLEKALWNETAGPTERSPSLDTALATAEAAIISALAARSTLDSIEASTRLIAGIRALALGKTNNMMFSPSVDGALDDDFKQNDFDSLDREAQPSSSMSHADPSAAAAMAHTPSEAPAQVTDSDVPAGPIAMSPEGRPIASVPLTTLFDVITDLTGRGNSNDWHALRSRARAETAPLKAKLERALKADEQTRWIREQERGEIDRASLSKLATSPGYRTPFRKKRIVKGRSAAVTLLIDRSGSMAGKKIELARLCAAALCDALVQLEFDCEVLGYSSIEDAGMRQFYESHLATGASLSHYNRFVERLDLHVYKRFGSNDLSGLSEVTCGHENPDGEALTWAAQRLADRTAERRILLVLSDGYPSTGDSNPAILRTDLRARVESLTLAGIELIGVGILNDAVESFYPKSIVVRQLDELPATAFRVLGHALLDR
jgi:nitric oxide reductase activation protein